MSTNHQNLIWIDLEMTGLDTQQDSIIEIATIITDSDLQIIEQGPSLAIKHDKSTLDKMDEWNTKQHGGSGLIDRVLSSTYDMQQAEQATLDFVKKYVPARVSPMCGNSICQDRRFMARLMPTLEAYFHYRHIDVSTIKELAKRWRPDIFDCFQKQGSHLALDDIKDSIRELQYYRQTFINTDSIEVS